MMRAGDRKTPGLLLLFLQGRTAPWMLLLAALHLSGCGLFFAKNDFLKATSEGRLKVGQTSDEVRAMLGNPDSTRGGTAGPVPVDVWIYKQTSGEDRTNYLATVAVTLGLWGIVPIHATEQHYVVLAGGKVVSWDTLPKNIQVPPEFVEDRPTTGRITTGTGFAIGRGYVLTNNHVVATMAKPMVYDQGQARPATVVLADQANDVALLKLDGGGDDVRKGLSLGDEAAVKQGDRVWTLGFPLTTVLGEKPILTEGIVSSTSGMGSDTRLFQITVPIQPGNSGGPLFNDRGEVVGITVSTLNAAKIFQLSGAVPQNINFAVKVTYARSLVGLLPEKTQPDLAAIAPPPPGLSLSALAEFVRPHVMLIKESR